MAAEETSDDAEQGKNATGPAIGFGSVSDPPSASAQGVCHDRSAASTADDLRDWLEAVAAAGDDVLCQAIGFRLSFTPSNPCGYTLEETVPLLGPKCFTYGPVPDTAISMDTAQVFSVAVKQIRPEVLGFHWPLQVYGFVVARDNLDFRCRNFIFNRDRNNCQILTPEDSSLVLTGPSRAVIADGPIILELELKVKGSKESEDKVLSLLVIEHDCINGRIAYGNLYREILSNKQSTTEVLFTQLEGAVEATVDAKVVEGSWSRFCPRIVARTRSFPDIDFVLFDPRGGTMVISDEGKIQLSRSVVTVESNGELELTAEAREHGSSTVVVSDTIRFTPKRIGMTDGVLNLGFCKMEVCVSWSLLAMFY